LNGLTDLSGNDGIDDRVDLLRMGTKNSDQEDNKVIWIRNKERIWLGGQVTMMIEVYNHRQALLAKIFGVWGGLVRLFNYLIVRLSVQVLTSVAD
jgi:hypothetical protein